jgi:hypothetical protein
MGHRMANYVPILQLQEFEEYLYGRALRVTEVANVSPQTEYIGWVKIFYRVDKSDYFLSNL